MSGARGWASVEGRRVLFRRWGEGPAVLLLHGSPQSSRTVAAMAEACAARGLCAIAPDTPGAGRSDPLPGDRPQSEDFARHLHGLANALGLGRVGVYGFHTGAATACAFGALFPDRTVALALEGLPAWTEEERTDFTAGYLPAWTPTWDGAHMAWLWARMEEQSVFFPWYAARPATRMRYPVSAKEVVHANCMDLLDAGDAHRAPYQAAFDFRPEPWLARLSAPTLIATTEFDVLRAHLGRPALAGRGLAFPTLAAIQAACAEHLAFHAGDPAPAPPSDARRGFVYIGSDVLAWRAGPGGGRPTIKLHAAGGGGLDPGDGEVAIDLPGHADSHEGWRTMASVLGEWTDSLEACLDALGLRDAEVVGDGVGGLIAENLAKRGVAAVGRNSGAGFGAPGAAEFDGALSLAPEWDGAHLVRAWRIARWEGLFSPWWRRDPAHALAPFGDLEPLSIQRRATSLLKAHDRWLAAARLET